MNINRMEQRVLHALAQGGRVVVLRDDNGRIVDVDCFSRDGWRLGDGTLAVFSSLRRKRLITSRGGGPYHISRQGLAAVRAQADNR